MKKKVETSEIPVSSTEVAMAHPEVRSNINLNLNHEDMIQLVIQDQIEKFEKDSIDVENALRSIRTRIEYFVSEYKAKCIKTHFKADAEYKKMVQLCGILGGDITEKISLDSGYNDDKKQVKLGKYFDLDLNSLENYKDPYGYAKRNVKEQEMLLTIPRRLTGNISVKTGNIVVVLTVDSERFLTKTDKEAYIKGIEPLLREQMNVFNLRYEINMKYLEFKYGEKRIKAKIVRASLQKSDEGRGILSMLEKATNIKMLS